jgi:predicted metal-dependent hydrolase
MVRRSAARSLVDGSAYTYRGVPHVLRIEADAKAREDGVEAGDGLIVVRLAGEPTPDRVEAALGAWVLAGARRELPAMLDECWGRFGRCGETRPTLRVRLMKTQWGSLAGRSRMTLNAHLQRAPAACAEAIIYHELCHMRVAGHGPDFYDELSAYVPDWKARRAELRTLLRG